MRSKKIHSILIFAQCNVIRLSRIQIIHIQRAKSNKHIKIETNYHEEFKYQARNLMFPIPIVERDNLKLNFPSSLKIF